MNTNECICAQCGDTFSVSGLIPLRDDAPVCSPCRVEAASVHRPHIGMVVQATRFALLEKNGQRANLTALAFVARLPEEYQTEARAAVNYVYETGRATPLIAALLRRNKIARVA